MNSNEFIPTPLEAATFDKIPTPMVAIDRQKIITFANKRALIDFDHSLPDAVINKDFRNFLSKEDQDRLPEIINQFVKAHVKLSHGRKSDDIYFPEVKIKTVSGKERYIRLTPKIVRSEEKDKTKHIIGTEIFITDITEEVRARALAEAIKIVGESELSKDDVLRKVRSILKSVVPHDTANLMLFDDLTDQLTLTVKDKWGYGGEGEPQTIDFTKTIKIEDKPLLRQMLISQKSLAVPNTEAEDKYIKTGQEPVNRSWIGAPLCIEIKGEKKVIGFLNLNNTKGYQYDASDEKILMTFADQIAIELKKSHKYEEKYRLSTTDHLTGLKNRRALDEYTQHEISEALRYDKPLSILILDIDHFKSINDTHGHLVGDAVLQSTAKLIQNESRGPIDITARYGGEEFSILMPESKLSDAFLTASKLKRILANNVIEHNDIKLSVKVSIGLTLIKKDDSLSLFLNRADEALYAAKNAGRNRVGVYLPGYNPVDQDRIAVYSKEENVPGTQVMVFDRLGKQNLKQIGLFKIVQKIQDYYSMTYAVYKEVDNIEKNIATVKVGRQRNTIYVEPKIGFDKETFAWLKPLFPSNSDLDNLQ